MQFRGVPLPVRCHPPARPRAHIAWGFRRLTPSLPPANENQDSRPHHYPRQGSENADVPTRGLAVLVQSDSYGEQNNPEDGQEQPCAARSASCCRGVPRLSRIASSQAGQRFPGSTRRGRLSQRPWLCWGGYADSCLEQKSRSFSSVVQPFTHARCWMMSLTGGMNLSMGVAASHGPTLKQ